jgi:hypothetical protein
MGIRKSYTEEARNSAESLLKVLSITRKRRFLIIGRREVSSVICAAGVAISCPSIALYTPSQAWGLLYPRSAQEWEIRGLNCSPATAWRARSASMRRFTSSR